jgi:hypothetical protein
LLLELKIFLFGEIIALDFFAADLIFERAVDGAFEYSAIFGIAEIKANYPVIEIGLRFSQFKKPFLGISDFRKLFDLIFIMRIILKVQAVTPYCYRLDDIPNLFRQILRTCLTRVRSIPPSPKRL